MNTYDWQDVQAAALGQWPEILQAHGIPYRHRRKNGPCPLCGGDDRSHWRDVSGRALLYCRQCETHWGDQVLLELCFGGDFGRMCNELGHWLHCQPAERKSAVKSRAKIAKTSNADSREIQRKLDAAAKVQTGIVPWHPAMDGYQHGKQCWVADGIDAALYPLSINGETLDWLAFDGEQQYLMSGDMQPCIGAAYALKPEGAIKDNVIIAPRITDALYLAWISNYQNLVLCCDTLQNLPHVADLIPDRYQIIAAVPNDLDSLDALQTLPYDFMMPADEGRGFCEQGYRYKPTKIYANQEAGRLFYDRLDKE